MKVATKKTAKSRVQVRPRAGSARGEHSVGVRPPAKRARDHPHMVRSPLHPSSGSQPAETDAPPLSTPLPDRPELGLSNVDLVTLAVCSLGGTTERVDTEDVAKRAHELAPGRLAWRKYPDQINLELVRVCLSDAKKAAKGAYLIGSGRTGWMLTQRGRRRAAHLASASPLLVFASPRANTAAAQRERAERGWVLGHPSLETLRVSGVDALSPRDLEALFRVDEYILGPARERRIARVLNAVAGDPSLVALLSPAAERVRSLKGR